MAEPAMKTTDNTITASIDNMKNILAAALANAEKFDKNQNMQAAKRLRETLNIIRKECFDLRKQLQGRVNSLKGTKRLKSV